MLLHVGFSLCWHFLFFSAVLPLASIYFILIRTCLPSHSTPRKGGWSCGKEKEEKGWGWGDVCYKVPPRVEHGHLSWGWKLKKRLVNLYSWSPRDRGKTQPGKTPPGERHKHTLTNTKTHTHTHPPAQMPPAALDPESIAAKHAIFPSWKTRIVSVVLFLPLHPCQAHTQPQ